MAALQKAQALKQGIQEGARNGSNTLLDGIQTGLDVVGLIPVVGEVADGVNALIYLGSGDYLNATLSVAAMLPIGGAGFYRW